MSNPNPAPNPNPNPDPSPAPAENYFTKVPETWRDDILSLAGVPETEVEARKNQLGRLTDVGSMVKSFFHAQDKIRKGEISSGLPENATPEQIAEYRKNNDIPEAADKYNLALDQGLQVSDHNKERIQKILNEAHSGMISNKVASKLVNTILADEKAQTENRQAQDGLDLQQASAMLKDRWGGDYQTNVNMVQNLVSKLPQDVQASFTDARMVDGKALLNDPSVFMWLADMAREINPAGFVAPNSNNPIQSINDEIATMEKRMGTDEWFKDEKSHARYRELVTARDKLSKK